jgi:predicted RNase H-like nuclease (RuvC/YqgF family)
LNCYIFCFTGHGVQADEVSTLEARLTRLEKENQQLKDQQATLAAENQQLKDQQAALATKNQQLKDHVATENQQLKDQLSALSHRLDKRAGKGVFVISRTINMNDL